MNRDRGPRGPRPHEGREAAPQVTVHPRPLMPADTWSLLQNNLLKVKHPFLLWNRFPPAFREDGKRLGKEGPKKQKEAEQKAWGEALDGLVSRMKTIPPEIPQELERRTLAAAESLRTGFGMKVLVAEAGLVEPLVSGQGEHHALEAGFCFHPILGIPFLKGSGVKGALRHRVLMRLAEKNQLQDLEDKTIAQAPLSLRRDMRRLFGTALKDPREEGKSRKEDRMEGESSGAVWCLDAFPLPGAMKLVDLDVLTPHHNDFDDPVPVVYLVVPAGVRWRFVVGIRREAGDLAEEVREAFRETLTVQGLGGKTSSAHGRFDEVKDWWLGEAVAPPAAGTVPGPVQESLPQEVQWFMEDAGRLRNLGEAKNLLNRVRQKHAKYLPLVANRAVESLGNLDPGAVSHLAAYCREKFGLEIPWKA